MKAVMVVDGDRFPESGARCPASCLLAGLFLLVLAACGSETGGVPPGIGGKGTLDIAGGPVVLRLEGAPYEMGYHHGFLLREAIRSLHAAWKESLRRAISERPQAPRGEHLAALLRLFVDQCRHRLPERWIQELEGMAAATGIAAGELLELEVMRDVFRIYGASPRLPGALGLTGEGTTLEAFAAWEGADSERLAANLLWVERRPAGGSPVGLLSWPGSLGGLAGCRPGGAGNAPPEACLLVAAEAEISDERRLGFGGGLPFGLVLRRALEENESVHDVAGGVGGTVGHVVISGGLARGDPTQVLGVASLEVFAAGEERPLFLRDDSLLTAGPFEEFPGREQEQLHAAVAAAPLEERWNVLTAWADGNPATTSGGPRLQLRLRAGDVLVRLWTRAGAKPRDVLFR